MSKNMKKKNILLLVGGLIFGFGLAYSGMAKPEVVLSFLQLNDLGLLFVMLPAALIAGVTFHALHKSKKKAPWTNLSYGFRRYPLGRNTILGGFIFGIGWGISGICPGASYASLGMGNYPIIFAILAMGVGASSYFYFAKYFPNNPLVKDHDKD